MSAKESSQNLISQIIQNNIIKKPYIPADACESEVRLHRYLDDNHVYTVDIKGFIDGAA